MAKSAAVKPASRPSYYYAYKKRTSVPYSREYVRTNQQRLRDAQRDDFVKQVRQVAQREYHRMVEDKEVRSLITNKLLYSFANQPVPANSGFFAQNILDCSQVWGSIPQGTGEGSRVGNQIRCTKFTYDAIISVPLTEEYVNQGPFHVKLWVISSRFNDQNASVQEVYESMCSTISNNFFDNGNAAQGMSGALIDHLMPVNLDRWRVHTTRTMKVGNSEAIEVGTYRGNNDFKALCNVHIDLLKYMPKLLKYNDTSTTLFNKKLFIVYEILGCGGNVISDTLNNPLLLHNACWHFKYEDA